ncbi:MAG: hypothetical protein MUP30_01550 [Deltaproteobacteria bacterium]|nr:hypothetical protein [Deltaproteobacteria bacterium]
MKKVLALVLVVVCCSFVSSVFAQSKTDEAEIARANLQTQKKEIVAANMQLTDAESKAFWPVYNEYQNGLRQINDKLAAVIGDFAKNYSTMTDAKAGEILNGYLATEKERLALKEKFVPKFKKVLPMIKVARYYQIENKLETMVKYQIVKEIPLAK